MKASQTFFPTLKEDPAEAEVISHKLMVRAAMIRKLAAGIYNYLPLGLRSLRRCENIVRQEMNRAGAQEIAMPFTQPAEIWQQSGRWEFYGKELMRLKDRHNRDFCLGPTHEEVVTSLVAKEVRSYRELPLNLYQIQPKFRDEIRPRFGVMRCREFIMKDAYSFDRDEASAEESYRGMVDAYNRIFSRCGLEFRAVEADTGNIGGSFSHEFMVMANTGESEIVTCSKCDYAANIEKAADKSEVGKQIKPSSTKLEEVATPRVTSVEEVAAFLKVEKPQIIKTILCNSSAGPVAAMVRGDYDVNLFKVQSVLGADWLELASDEEIRQWTGGEVGFSGPVDLKNVTLIADELLQGGSGYVTGANKKDAHFKGVDLKRDTTIKTYADIRLVHQGSLCHSCGGSLDFSRGIEVGHTFMLGTKYSEVMGALFTDEDKKEKPMIMGCYGIGVGRTVAAAIEQNHDDDGIVFPQPLAPFDATILVLDPQNDAISKKAEEIHRSLADEGYDVLVDERDERPGRKFKDADLIGIPLRITLGAKKFANGEGELKLRKDKENEVIKLEQLTSKASQLLKANKERV